VGRTIKNNEEIIFKNIEERRKYRSKIYAPQHN
jgi:hypothetical protein